MSKVRSLVGSMLPEQARYVLWQRVGPRLGLGEALGHRVPVPIDLRVLDIIRNGDRVALADPAVLEMQVLPMLGFNEDLAEIFPSHLNPHLGLGVRSSQYPSQFSRYLNFLRGYPIGSYLEIGVQHGGTFLITVEYLRRFHELPRAVAMDMFDVPALHAYDGGRFDATLLKMDSRSRKAKRHIDDLGPFDLVLVDGDHAEAGCRADFELVRGAANMVAFHDIVGSNTPGVRQVWSDVRADFADEYDFVEFVDQYDEVRDRTDASFLGIGLAVRKEFR